MSVTQIIMIMLGTLSIFLGMTGVYNKSRRGQRMVGLVGETGAKILYSLFGLAVIVFALFI